MSTVPPAPVRIVVDPASDQMADTLRPRSWLDEARPVSDAIEHALAGQGVSYEAFVEHFQTSALDLVRTHGAERAREMSQAFLAATAL